MHTWKVDFIFSIKFLQPRDLTCHHSTIILSTTEKNEIYRLYSERFSIVVIYAELTLILSRNFLFLSQHISQYTHTHTHPHGIDGARDGSVVWWWWCGNRRSRSNRKKKNMAVLSSFFSAFSSSASNCCCWWFWQAFCFLSFFSFFFSWLCVY